MATSVAHSLLLRAGKEPLLGGKCAGSPSHSWLPAESAVAGAGPRAPGCAGRCSWSTDHAIPWLRVRLLTLYTDVWPRWAQEAGNNRPREQASARPSASMKPCWRRPIRRAIGCIGALPCPAPAVRRSSAGVIDGARTAGCSTKAPKTASMLKQALLAALHWAGSDFPAGAGHWRNVVAQMYCGGSEASW